MEVQNQAMIFDALRLARLFRDQVDRVREKMIILFLALVGIFVIHFFFSYLLTNRRILKSISHLGSGTKIIGSGNLDHVLTVKSKDEVGELSDEFNRMTASLKAITASKTELEREIVERKQTEEALQQRTLEFQHLTETLEERVKERTAELSELTSRLVAAQENERKTGFL